MKCRQLIFFTVCCSATAFGAFTDSFETGITADWSIDGYVYATNMEMSRDWANPAAPDHLPSHGQWFASLWTIDPDTFDAFPNGSRLERTFEAVDGDILRFDYFVDFGDEQEHVAEIKLSTTTTTQTLLYLSGAEGDHLPWTTYTSGPLAADEYTLSFLILDPLGLGGFESFMGVDNVSLTVIPAPGALLLASTGLSVVGWLRRRRAI